MRGSSSAALVATGITVAVAKLTGEGLAVAAAQVADESTPTEPELCVVKAFWCVTEGALHEVPHVRAR